MCIMWSLQINCVAAPQNPQLEHILEKKKVSLQTLSLCDSSDLQMAQRCVKMVDVAREEVSRS